MVEIDLLPINREDLPLLQSWRNSDSVLPYCRQYRPLSDRDMELWYESLHKDREFNLTNDLFIMNCGEPIGVGGLVRIDWRNRKGEVSFYVAEEVDNTTIRKALARVVQYGISTLGLWKLYFPVYSFNPRLGLYKKVMKEEYIARQEYYWEDKYHDRIILTAYQKDFKWNTK